MIALGWRSDEPWCALEESNIDRAERAYIVPRGRARKTEAATERGNEMERERVRGGDEGLETEGASGRVALDGGTREGVVCRRVVGPTRTIVTKGSPLPC